MSELLTVRVAAGSTGRRVLDAEAMDLRRRHSHHHNARRPSPDRAVGNRPRPDLARQVEPLPSPPRKAGRARRTQRPESAARNCRGSARRRPALASPSSNRRSIPDCGHHARRGQRAQAQAWRRGGGDYQVHRGHDRPVPRKPPSGCQPLTVLRASRSDGFQASARLGITVRTDAIRSADKALQVVWKTRLTARTTGNRYRPTESAWL